MRAVRGKNTLLELSFRQALWRAGARGWRLHSKHVPGTPDLVFSRLKIAVFVDSCFWHGCPEHLRMPKSNRYYWEAKIGRNKERDDVVTAGLQETGWVVLRYWEHELRESMAAAVRRTIKVVTARRHRAVSSGFATGDSPGDRR